MHAWNSKRLLQRNHHKTMPQSKVSVVRRFVTPHNFETRGFHSHGGSPITGWFISYPKVTENNMGWFRGTPMTAHCFGNLRNLLIYVGSRPLSFRTREEHPNRGCLWLTSWFPVDFWVSSILMGVSTINHSSCWNKFKSPVIPAFQEDFPGVHWGEVVATKQAMERFHRGEK